MDWQGVLCFEYCEKNSYKNVPGFSDISLRAIKSCFIVLGTIHKHGYTVCHKSCSKEGIAHYDSQNMTFMSCLWLLPECFLMKLKMCVCVHVCVCAIRVCVTEKETSSKKLFFTQARGFHFSPFQKTEYSPPERKRKRQKQQFLHILREICATSWDLFPFVFISSKSMRWSCAVSSFLSDTAALFWMKVEICESVPMPKSFAKLSLML